MKTFCSQPRLTAKNLHTEEGRWRLGRQLVRPPLSGIIYTYTITDHLQLPLPHLDAAAIPLASGLNHCWQRKFNLDILVMMKVVVIGLKWARQALDMATGHYCMTTTQRAVDDVQPAVRLLQRPALEAAACRHSLGQIELWRWSQAAWWTPTRSSIDECWEFLAPPPRPAGQLTVDDLRFEKKKKMTNFLEALHAHPIKLLFKEEFAQSDFLEKHLDCSLSSRPICSLFIFHLITLRNVLPLLHNIQKCPLLLSIKMHPPRKNFFFPTETRWPVGLFFCCCSKWISQQGEWLCLKTSTLWDKCNNQSKVSQNEFPPPCRQYHQQQAEMLIIFDTSDKNINLVAKDAYQPSQ